MQQYIILASFRLHVPVLLGDLLLLLRLSGYTWFELYALSLYEHATGYKRKTTISTTWLMSMVALPIYSLQVRLSTVKTTHPSHTIRVYYFHRDRKNIQGHLSALVRSLIVPNLPL
jgi:hypothetical protein